MLEIERKILEIDPRAFKAQLKKIKPRPKKIFEGFVRVKYFDFPDRRILRARNLLRLREISPKGKKPFTEFVYKVFRGVRQKSKYFEEHEITAREPGSFENLSALLKKLGFIQTVYYEKKRTLYKWGKVKFELDEHPKIPPFLEIEAESPGAIDRAIRLLNLQNHEQSALSIAELMKKKYPKTALNGLRFPRSGL